MPVHSRACKRAPSMHKACQSDRLRDVDTNTRSHGMHAHLSPRLIGRLALGCFWRGIALGALVARREAISVRAERGTRRAVV